MPWSDLTRLVRIHFAVVNSVMLVSLFVLAYTLPVPSSCLINSGLHLFFSEYKVNGVPDCGAIRAVSSGGSTNAWSVDGGIRDSLTVNLAFLAFKTPSLSIIGANMLEAPRHPIGIDGFFFS